MQKYYNINKKKYYVCNFPIYNLINMKNLLLVFSTLIFFSIIFYSNINNSVGKKNSKILIFDITGNIINHQNNLNINKIYLSENNSVFYRIKVLNMNENYILKKYFYLNIKRFI